MGFLIRIYICHVIYRGKRVSTHTILHISYILSSSSSLYNYVFFFFFFLMCIFYHNSYGYADGAEDEHKGLIFGTTRDSFFRFAAVGAWIVICNFFLLIVAEIAKRVVLKKLGGSSNCDEEFEVRTHTKNVSSLFGFSKAFILFFSPVHFFIYFYHTHTHTAFF